MFVYRAAFQLAGPQPVYICGVIPPQLQDFVFPFVELYEVPVGPFLQPVSNGSTSVWSISHSFQFCIMYKLAEGAVCPNIQVINEEVKQCWPHY